MWSTILSAILSIISNIIKIFADRSSNKDITDNEKAKKMFDNHDELKRHIEDSFKTGDLNQVRKDVSE